MTIVISSIITRNFAVTTLYRCPYHRHGLVTRVGDNDNDADHDDDDNDQHHDQHPPS